MTTALMAMRATMTLRTPMLAITWLPMLVSTIQIQPTQQVNLFMACATNI